MAYDEGLAQRVREQLAETLHITEKTMFGGLSFLLAGHMCVGIVKQDLVVRVGPDMYENALSRPHARPMDFTKRPMKGWIYVAPAGVESDDTLIEWVSMGLAFAGSLKPK